MTVFLQKWSCVMLLVVLFTNNCESYHDENSSWNSNHFNQNHGKIPQDVMSDVINNLGLRLLAIHNENNDNNIAISPYGALSVLVALAEGVQGDGQIEIRKAADIPLDLSLIRVGLRDIHRHLKSYFIPEEGFLAGLSLSHDNVSLNREYEDILKFYGYDLNSFNNVLYPDLTTTEFSKTTTEMSTESTTTEIPEKTESSSLELSTEPLTTQTDRTTRSESTTVTVPPTTTSSTVPSTTMIQSKSEEPQIIVTNTQSPTTTTEVVGSTTTSVPSTTLSDADISTTTMQTPTSTEVIASTTSTITSTTTPTITTVEDGTITTVLLTTLSSSTTATESESETTSSVLSVTDSLSTTTEVLFELINVTDSTTTMSTENNLELNSGYRVEKLTGKRIKRSVLDYLIARYYDDHMITQRPTIDNGYMPSPQSADVLTFLIDGKYRESNINFMTYDTVLPFAYVPHLESLALRFPLDSDRYYLLLLLPVNDGPMGIDRLLYNLKLDGNLKQVIKMLKYTHVRAVIPSFMLKGYVTLTPTFQKLGIRKVFEPRQSDFSPMTPERGIYVTNIEQAITVNIRNYVDPSSNNNDLRYLQKYEPIHFKADHPFLYFVIDSDIHVTLMAGKILNPLNSRIR